MDRLHHDSGHGRDDRAFSLQNIKYVADADEGYYWKYAVYVSENGFGGFHELLADFNLNQKHWFYPSPLRVGFIALSAFAVKLFGRSFFSLSYLSLFSYSIFLIVTFAFAKKHFDEMIALLLVILCAFSPLQMAMARRALMDSTANTFVILSLWLFLR